METRSNSKTGMGLLILGAMLVCLFSGLAHAQENWVYIYDNPNADRNELFRDVQRSPYDGYLYACGRAYRTTNYSRLCLTKLNPVTGDTVWHRRFDPPGTDYHGDGYELDFDNAGNIYVAGGVQVSHNYDFAIVKYTPAGDVIRYNLYHIGSNSRVDYARSVDIGPDNMVYVAGYTEDSDAETEFIVRKYDTTLTYTGRQYYVDYNGREMNAYRVRVDNNLNVWACGDIYTGNYLKFTVVKLDTHMTEQARYQAGMNTNGADRQEAYDLCLPWGGGGGVYACGCKYGSVTAQNFFVVKLDNNCNAEWSKTIAASGAEKAYRVVSGPSGATYVAGYTRTPSGQAENYTVVCYSGSIEAWRYRKNGSMNNNDKALDIVLDPSGSYAYATGQVRNTGQDYDMFVTKHTAMDSLPVWEYTYNGPANQHDIGRSIVLLASDGNVHVGGNIEKDISYYEAGAISLPQNFPPSVPTLISPVNSGFENDTTSVKFTWNKSTDPEGDAISGYYIGCGIDPTFTVYDSVWRTGTTYTTSVPAGDTVYYWAVKSRGTGESDWSGVWSFVFDFTPPNSPVLTSPTAGAYEQDTSVFFDWGTVTFMESPSPVTYVIQVDNDAGFPAPIIDTTDVDSITFELPSEDVYFWHVKAFDAAGNESSYSGTGSFTVDATPPLIDLTDELNNTTSGGPFTINTQVTDVYGVDSVLLYYWRVMTEPIWFPVKMTAAADDWFQAVIPETIQENDTTKYYIKAWDNASWVTSDPATAPTDYYSFIANYFDPGIGEFDTPASFSFGLKNNPAKGKAMFSMSLPEDGLITLRIYDVMGRLIDKPVSGTMTAGTYEISWTSKVSSGIFFYRLDSPWQQRVGKLILVR